METQTYLFKLLQQLSVVCPNANLTTAPDQPIIIEIGQWNDAQMHGFQKLLQSHSLECSLRAVAKPKPMISIAITPKKIKMINWRLQCRDEFKPDFAWASDADIQKELQAIWHYVHIQSKLDSDAGQQ